MQVSGDVTCVIRDAVYESLVMTLILYEMLYMSLRR